MKARRSRLLRLQGSSSTVVCLEGQQTFCGSFDCLFVFRIPKISQERNSYALQSSASSYGGHSNRSSKVQKKTSPIFDDDHDEESSIITLTRLKRGLLTAVQF